MSYSHEDYRDAFDRKDTLALALMDMIDELEKEAAELRTEVTDLQSEIDEQLGEIRQQRYEIGELNARISALIREAAK